MPVRSRVRTTTLTGTRVYKPTSAVDSRTIINSDERCEDVTGLGDNNPFTVTRITRSGGLISGPGGWQYSWNDYPCVWLTDAWTSGHIAISGHPGNGTLAAKLAARTQPYKADTVSWEYLSDLHDLGGMAQSEFEKRLWRLKRYISQRAFRGLSRLAKANLLYQFGILPLASDIEVLLKFQQLVDKRVAVLKKTYEDRGYRRTVDLWSGSSTLTANNVTLQSQGILLDASAIKKTEQKVRGHIRWHSIIPIQPSDQQMRDRAKSVVLGTEIDPFVVYELLPWSWLVDYFSNLGSIVQAGKNMFDVYHDAVRIMTHTRTITRSYNHKYNPQGSCTPVFVTSESKTRVLATPSITARETLLTEGQTSILGSLVVLRSLK